MAQLWVSLWLGFDTEGKHLSRRRDSDYHRYRGSTPPRLSKFVAGKPIREVPNECDQPVQRNQGRRCGRREGRRDRPADEHRGRRRRRSPGGVRPDGRCHQGEHRHLDQEGAHVDSDECPHRRVDAAGAAGCRAVRAGADLRRPGDLRRRHPAGGRRCGRRRDRGQCGQCGTGCVRGRGGRQKRKPFPPRSSPSAGRERCCYETSTQSSVRCTAFCQPA